MQVTVTKEAQTYLENKQADYIRIVARDTYECSTMIEFYLTIDEYNPSEDECIEKGQLRLIYNKKASEEIGSQLKIDFIASQGLKMINQNQTLAYGLGLK